MNRPPLTGSPTSTHGGSVTVSFNVTIPSGERRAFGQSDRGDVVILSGAFAQGFVDEVPHTWCTSYGYQQGAWILVKASGEVA